MCAKDFLRITSNFYFAEAKKDSTSQLKDVETKLQKALEENRTFNDKMRNLEEKLSKQDQSVSFYMR